MSSLLPWVLSLTLLAHGHSIEFEQPETKEVDLQAGETLAKKIIFLSIPKSGTFLTKKTVELISNRPVEWITRSIDPNPVPNFATDLDPMDPTIVFHHLFSSLDFIRDDASGRYIKVVVIRDPRDALISQIHWLEGCDVCWYSPEEYNRSFNALSFQERVTKGICFPESAESFSIRSFTRKALEWMAKPDVFVLRFEDLVGAEGGGDPERQGRTLLALAEHLGTPLTSERLGQIQSSLFGESFTFRKGQIGSWREYFTQEDIQIFKERMGEELIQLGYEKDNSW